MNRKTFLATIAGVIAAPFVVKAKPVLLSKHEHQKSFTPEEVAEFQKAFQNLGFK